MNNTQKLATIDTLLQGVPQFQCVEGCADCCGPVTMTALEWKRLTARSGDTKLKEKMVAVTKGIMDGGHGSCPLLDIATNKCSVYDIRPAICRVFGASTATTQHSSMVCPHGRKPDQPLTKVETDTLLDKIQLLGGPAIVPFSFK